MTIERVKYNQFLLPNNFMKRMAYHLVFYMFSRDLRPNTIYIVLDIIGALEIIGKRDYISSLI